MLVSLAGPAVAADAKLESGSVCEFSLNSALFNHTRRNGFLNLSGETRRVVCPMVKEDLSIDAVISVDVLTSTGISGNDCQLSSRPFGGGSLSFSAPNSVAFVDGARQFVHWDAVPAPGGTAMEVECPVPDGESIFSIQHAED
jgi:hypothetical protein